MNIVHDTGVGGYENIGLVVFIDMTTETGYGIGTRDNVVHKPYCLVDTELK